MDTVLAEPPINADAIRSWCDVVFGYLSGQAAVRLIGEIGTKDQPPHQQFVPVDQIAERLGSLAPGAARGQRAVFVVPAGVRPGVSAKAADVLETGVILVDLDHGDVESKRGHLVRHLGAPSLEVASGGRTAEGQAKLHLYWRLSEAAAGPDLNLVADLRGEIARKVGGDESFRNIAQPIRVAGTIHGKNGRRSPVRILSINPAEYHLAEFADVVRLMPSMQDDDRLQKPSDVGRKAGPNARVLATRIIREAGEDGITRYDAMSRVIGHWLRQVRNRICTLKEALEAVEGHNAAMIRPPWPEARLRREFNALLKRDIISHGPMPFQTEVTPPGAKAPDLSEDALAQDFVREAAGLWHHVEAWGGWFTWTGTHWQKDAVGSAFQAVRLSCRGAAQNAGKPADARRIASTRTIQFVQKIVAHDPVIARSPDAFDQHPTLINTPTGILDLDTGEMTSHDSELLLTQVTRSSPGTGCPRWLAFLEQATGSNAELQSYLARVAGYCLSGSTREQVFFFLHGSGANGKSVFLQTLAWLLGDYAVTATADAFTDRGQTRHLTELAGLRAARLVLVSETEVGEGWAEARIKSVTGGERVRANFMYRDHFEFTPQFKLLIAGNHRPSLADVGEAMRRRLHVIPFSVTVPPDDRDPLLGAHLKAEADGIFSWMLAGCLDWRDRGLLPPAAVTGAGEDYFSAEDRFGQWIEECCLVGSDRRALAKALYGSWSDWARTNGYDPGSSRALGEQLRARGFRPGKSGVHRGWLGLTVHHPLREGGGA